MSFDSIKLKISYNLERLIYISIIILESLFEIKSATRMTEIYESQKNIINQHSIMAATASVPGALVPALDLPAYIAIWATMLTRLASDSGHSFDEKLLIKQMTSATVGVGLFYAGFKTVLWFGHAFPGVGSLGVLSVNAILAVILTRRLGLMACKLFNDPDFNVDMFWDALQSLMTATLTTVPSGDEIRDAREVAKQTKR